MSIESTLVERYVKRLTCGLGSGSIVVGDGAAALAFAAADMPFRRIQNITLVVTPASYEHLRARPVWSECIIRDGVRRLRHGMYEVATLWNGLSYEALHERAWRTDLGTEVASLADVYLHKQGRGLPKDIRDMAIIRARLQGPGSVPLPAQMLVHEVKAISAALPEHLRGREEAQSAIHLAANGFHIISTLYGGRGTGRVGHITGTLEKPEYHVPATYHNGLGLAQDLSLLQRHFAAIGASDIDRLDGLISDVYSDAIYGNGRYSDNPRGHDELLSARLVARHAEHFGFSPQRTARLRNAILGTTFDERTGVQRGKCDLDPVARAVTGVDLQTLCEANSAETSIDLAIEDGFSARFSAARTIGKVLTARGVRVESTTSGLAAIDTYGDLKPANVPDGPTVLQAFASRLRGSAFFHELHTYPADWTLDNPALRRDHAAFLRELSEKLLRPRVTGITAVKAYELARQHTYDMQVRYSRAA